MNTKSKIVTVVIFMCVIVVFGYATKIEALVKTKIDISRAVITKNLIAYYTFDGKNMTNATTTDTSGNNNNGTLINNPKPDIGKIGQALRFNGSNSYIDLGAPALFNNISPMTIILWQYLDGTTSATSTILDKTTSGTVTRFSLSTLWDAPAGRISFRVCFSSGCLIKVTQSGSVKTGTWQLVTITFDGSISASNTHIYVNGIEVSGYIQSTDGIGSRVDDSGINLTIGGQEGGSVTNVTKGKFDDVRIYNRVLSTKEIKQLVIQNKVTVFPNSSMIATIKSTPSFTCGVSTVKDADNNVYNTLTIGTQCWMKQNMRVGTRIAASSNQTNNSTIEKYCYSNSDANCTSNNPNQPDGGLYQWDEAMQYVTTAGARGICPAGWHIPTDGEQYTLENYLKDNGQTCNASRIGSYDCDTAGTKLKPNGSSGFEGNLAGYALAGSFGSRGSFGYF